MLAKAKAAASSASESAARTAKKTKLQGEIMLLQQRITTAKKEFGPLVFDAMVASINGPEVDRIFNETRQKVEALQADIDAKRLQVDELGHSTPRGPVDVSSGEAPVAPPPPGPPPNRPPLPPGWRVTKTAEGKEYYYHESTGETSWTVPAS
jgi:hypothetical protein